MGYSEADYAETLLVYSSAIEDFSASKFKIELEKYLNYQPDETLVFIFDEASEAISQNKFSLLDLEGISEALSAASAKKFGRLRLLRKNSMMSLIMPM